MFRPWAAGDKWGVELTEGIFDGVVIQIEEVKFLDNSDNGNVEMEYNRIHTPAHLNESDFQSENFSNVMNSVINQILMEAVQHYEQNRNNDPTEPS